MKKYWFEKDLEDQDIEELFFHYGDDIYSPDEYCIDGEGEIIIYEMYGDFEFRYRETGIFLSIDMNELLKDFKGEMND